MDSLLYSQQVRDLDHIAGLLIRWIRYEDNKESVRRAHRALVTLTRLLTDLEYQEIESLFTDDVVAS